MMLQAESIRRLVFVIAAAMMMASNAFSQVISDSGTQELHGSALHTPNSTASSGRLMRSRRPSLVITTANGRRVVIGLKKPGLRPRRKNSERTTRGSFRQKAQGSTVAGRVNHVRGLDGSDALRAVADNRSGKNN